MNHGREKIQKQSTDKKISAILQEAYRGAVHGFVLRGTHYPV